MAGTLVLAISNLVDKEDMNEKRSALKRMMSEVVMTSDPFARLRE